MTRFCASIILGTLLALFVSDSLAASASGQGALTYPKPHETRTQVAGFGSALVKAIIRAFDDTAEGVARGARRGAREPAPPVRPEAEEAIDWETQIIVRGRRAAERRASECRENEEECPQDMEGDAITPHEP